MSVGACYDCGLPYVSDAWIDAVVMDDVWDQIRPTAACGSGGLLCIGCMARRCVTLGIDHVALYLGSGPFILVPKFDPSTGERTR